MDQEIIKEYFGKAKRVRVSDKSKHPKGIVVDSEGNKFANKSFYGMSFDGDVVSEEIERGRDILIQRDEYDSEVEDGDFYEWYQSEFPPGSVLIYRNVIETDVPQSYSLTIQLPVDLRQELESFGEGDNRELLNALNNDSSNRVADNIITYSISIDFSDADDLNNFYELVKGNPRYMFAVFKQRFPNYITFDRQAYQNKLRQYSDRIEEVGLKNMETEESVGLFVPETTKLVELDGLVESESINGKFGTRKDSVSMILYKRHLG
jgi:hypothetical protein